jgi:hypothetical protein
MCHSCSLPVRREIRKFVVNLDDRFIIKHEEQLHCDRAMCLGTEIAGARTVRVDGGDFLVARLQRKTPLDEVLPVTTMDIEDYSGQLKVTKLT